MELRKLALLSLIVLAILLVGCTQSQVQQVHLPSPSPPSSVESANNVEITASGFSPATLTVHQGDTVMFVNKDSSTHWPASAVHPTHNVYPESGGCIGSKFDACKRLAEGESFSFTFNEKGSWKYHDHLNPRNTGTIVVE